MTLWEGCLVFLDINCPQIKNILDLEDSVIYLTYITKNIICFKTKKYITL